MSDNEAWYTVYHSVTRFGHLFLGTILEHFSAERWGLSASGSTYIIHNLHVVQQDWLSPCICCVILWQSSSLPLSPIVLLCGT